MSDEKIIKQINQALDDVRPNIQMDGGDIELVSFEDGIVSVKFSGACVGCPLSYYTLKLGIEEQLKNKVPDAQIQEVVAVEW